MKLLIGTGLRAFTAALLILSAIYLFGLLTRPDRDPIEFSHLPEEVAEREADRREFDLASAQYALHRHVDYAEGPGADWYPKGESPLLNELVDEGRLAPVADRVGPQPAVIQGIDGVGRYGGTWFGIASSNYDLGIVIPRQLSGAFIYRWSPLGYPLAPHLAREVEIQNDYRDFIVHLREGLRWSDGHPFTSEDIRYWWEDENLLLGQSPRAMLYRGQLGQIEILDTYTVRFRFPEPHVLFPERMAENEFWAPSHYLRPYHPQLGDPEQIEIMRRQQEVPSARAAYYRLKHYMNPEHPRLWPWVVRQHQTVPPFEFVRNPYYFAVDAKGNQLPYIDRLLMEVRPETMASASIAAGDVSMQYEYVHFKDYTLYSEEGGRNGIQLYHWINSRRADFLVYPNLNRRIDPDDAQTRWKHEYLNRTEFRRALSLAINRKEIIRALYYNQTEPAQLDPGKLSPYHHPQLYSAFTEFDPEEANRLLDAIGLVKRDGEGFRTFPDGTRMTFYLHVTETTGQGPSPFLTDDWGAVGIRVIVREQARSLWQILQATYQHDLTGYWSESDIYPLVEPRNFLPTATHSFYAPGFAVWYRLGGLYGSDLLRPSAIEPPVDHPLRRAMMVYEEASRTVDPVARDEVFREVLDIAAENLWTIGINSPLPKLVAVKEGMRNVPRKALSGWSYSTPANTGPETFSFDQPADSAGARAQIKRLMVEVVPDPKMALDQGAGEATNRTGAFVASLIRWLILITVLLALALAVLRHPFIGRRIVVLTPALFIISIVIFTIIQLPPGSYIENRLIRLEMEGNEAAMQEVEELKDIFHLDRSMPERYLRWLGLPWFLTFDSSDRGLLQGSLGRSMEDGRYINELIGDRILLTLLISFLTILFTWSLAIPIGIFSAVRQYSIGDYVFTLFGFLGMCIPNFLLALFLMYASASLFDMQISGLFSPAYAAQPEWSLGKFVDLLKHIWIPVVVTGTGSTAWMIRVMRGNLLDELKKPYVVTARAKGVRPLRLLFKYPVRIALNPFISGIGSLFPQLVSGSAIVAIVLSLPTVGPLLLSSLISQDMYVAGSMLMVLSLLAVTGTLVSDLLLMWVDPRIRIGK